MSGCGSVKGAVAKYNPFTGKGPRTVAAADPAQTESSGLASSSGLSISSDKLSAAAPANAVFYFELNSSVLKPGATAYLEGSVAYLLKHPKARVRIEGHTDERGSAEYNVALGWRRAGTVSDYLEEKGVSAKQIIVLSYGKEKPATLGHSESVWRINRRVNFVYTAS